MWKNRIIGYEEVDPEQLLANPRNWRIHPQSQQEALEGVLDEVGWVDDIIVNKRTGFVLDGHLRAALAISQEQKTVPVKYIDVSEDEEMLLLATFDPITAMAVADKENLAELMTGIDSDNERIQGLLDDIAKREGIELEMKETPEAQIDRAEELQEKWQVERGQIWKIGRHRLMCGDSTKEEDIEQLMDDSKARMCFIDPPYAIFGSSTGVKSEVTDDNLIRPFFRILGKTLKKIVLPRGHTYICCDWRSFPTVRDEVGSSLAIKNNIVWSKGETGYAGSFYSNNYENIAFFVNELKTHSMFKSYTKNGTPKHLHIYGSNVWHIDRVPIKEREHFAEKPVEVISKAIENSSYMNELIVDLFMGSGTTMVAAEQLNRICYGMEIEPKYCAVTLERMSDMGLKPKLLDT